MHTTYQAKDGSEFNYEGNCRRYDNQSVSVIFSDSADTGSKVCLMLAPVTSSYLDSGCITKEDIMRYLKSLFSMDKKNDLSKLGAVKWLDTIYELPYTVVRHWLPLCSVDVKAMLFLPCVDNFTYFISNFTIRDAEESANITAYVGASNGIKTPDEYTYLERNFVASISSVTKGVWGTYREFLDNAYMCMLLTHLNKCGTSMTKRYIDMVNRYVSKPSKVTDENGRGIMINCGLSLDTTDIPKHSRTSHTKLNKDDLFDDMFSDNEYTF